MKKQFIFLLTLFLSLNAYSQISFEEGYFIDRENQKTNCLIKNSDWKNNPIEIEYKLTENSKIQKATIKTVKEFGIYNVSRYVGETVMIDKTYNEEIGRLTEDRNPVFIEETLFLEVLIEGKASLYSYVEGRLKKYFYNKDDSKIEQLMFKKYIAEELKIGTNNGYKQQLFNDLKCPTFKMSKYERLAFRKNTLIKFFIEYNECNKQEYKNYNEKKGRHLFNLNIRPGFNISSLSIKNETYQLNDIDLDNEFAFRFGIEAEYILPFNKNKWGIVIEPTYQNYKSEKTNRQEGVGGSLLTTNVDYSSIEIPVSIRHYFYLNNNSKLFINASWILDLTINKSVVMTRDDGHHYDSFEMETRPNLAFGVGYKLYEKYSLEMRYHIPRNAAANSLFWDVDYNALSFILGYTLF